MIDFYMQLAKTHRRNLFNQLPAGGLAVISASQPAMRNGGTPYRYRPDSNFFYLTGIATQPAVAVLWKNAKEDCHYWLFAPDRNPERTRWEGYMVSFHDQEEYLFDAGFDIAHLEKTLKKRISNVSRCVTQVNEAQQHIVEILCGVEIEPLAPLIHELRLIKSSHELRAMTKAASVSITAHKQCMQQASSIIGEQHLHATLLQAFHSNNMQEAYPSIVASGKRSCILHYQENNQPLAQGDLVLIDAGAEYNCYSSDVTRCFPVSGTFTPAQRDVYQIVLAAQNEAIAAVNRNHTIVDVHQKAVMVLTQGLLDLKILQGNLESNVAQKKYAPYYMHGTSHWLGMDVHDPGDYSIDAKPRQLEPGMVITVEPGLYLDHHSVADEFRNIGIRIEDDVAVTSSDPTILSKGKYREVAEIEAQCQK